MASLVNSTVSASTTPASSPASTEFEKLKPVKAQIDDGDLGVQNTFFTGDPSPMIKFPLGRTSSEPYGTCPASWRVPNPKLPAVTCSSITPSWQTTGDGMTVWARMRNVGLGLLDLASSFTVPAEPAMGAMTTALATGPSTQNTPSTGYESLGSSASFTPPQAPAQGQISFDDGEDSPSSISPNPVFGWTKTMDGFDPFDDVIEGEGRYTPGETFLRSVQSRAFAHAPLHPAPALIPLHSKSSDADGHGDAKFELSRAVDEASSSVDAQPLWPPPSDPPEEPTAHVAKAYGHCTVHAAGVTKASGRCTVPDGLELVRDPFCRQDLDYLDFSRRAKEIEGKKNSVLSPWIHIKSTGGLMIKLRLKIVAKQVNLQKGGGYFKRSGYLAHVQLLVDNENLATCVEGTKMSYTISLLDVNGNEKESILTATHDFADGNMTDSNHEFNLASALTVGHFTLRVRMLSQHRFEDRHDVE